MLLPKNHYAAWHWQLRKNFLDYLEDSMSQDSLFGSTISTRYQKNISCANKISSPSILSQDTKAPKVSEGSNKRDFFLRICGLPRRREQSRKILLGVHSRNLKDLTLKLVREAN